MYGVLVFKDRDVIKCKACGGEGSVDVYGGLKVCRVCSGKGNVALRGETEKLLKQFQIRPVSVDESLSTVYKFIEPFDALRCLDAFRFGGFKARIIYHIF